MKSKFISILILGIMIVSLIPIHSVFAATIFEDDFDNADPLGSWTLSEVGVGDVSVSNSIYYDGNSSIKIYDPDGSNWAYMYQTIADYPDDFHSKWVFYVDSSVTPFYGQIVTFKDDNNGREYPFYANYTAAGKYMLEGYVGSSRVNLIEIPTETWIVCDVFIDGIAKTYSLYVNGMLVGVGDGFTYGAPSELIEVGSDNFSSDLVIYFDSIIIDENMTLPDFSGYLTDLSSPVFREDFEDWNYFEWDEIGGGVTVDSGSAFEGSFGGNFSAGAGISMISRESSHPDVSNTTLRYMFKWTDHSLVGGYQDAHWLSAIYLDDGDASGNPQRSGVIIECNETPQKFYFRLYNIFDNDLGGSDAVSNDTGVEVIADQWYFITQYLEIINDTAIYSSLVVSGIEVTETMYADADEPFTKVRIGCAQVQSADDIEEFCFDYIEISPMSYEFVNIFADLENVDDDGADWVFTDWRYYRFTLETNIPDTYNATLRWNISIGIQTVAAGFYSDGSNWYYADDLGDEDVTRYGHPMNLRAGSWDYNSTTEVYTVTYFIWFNDQCLDLWDASDGVDIYYQLNAGTITLGAANYFRIYSSGGFTMNTESSDTDHAYILDGGSPFSFHVEDDGVSNQWMYNEIWYRDVNHMKLAPDIHFLAGLDAFTVKYGFDYSIGDGEWIEGNYINIQPDFVSYTGVFAGNVWINMTLSYNDRVNGVISTDVLYMFYHGSVSGSGDPGHWKSWIDLWISDKNASSVNSIRINAFEYPMIDSADLWLRWLANNWGVMDNATKEMRGDASLYDDTNQTMSSEKIRMVRYWSNITVYSLGGGQEIEVRTFDAFDSTKSRDLPITGTTDPIFDETKIPTVGNTGILGALASLFSGLATWMSENVIFGGLNLWGTFVNFLDTIAAWLGAPKFFTNLFTWIGEAVGNLTTAFDYLSGVTVDIFSLFASLLGAFLDTMGELITSVVNTITIFTDMMGGAYGVGVDLWTEFQISTWITLALIFYPLYLLILWEESGMDAVIQQLTWIFGLLSWVFDFMAGVIREAIMLITSLIESIPVAE